MYEGKSAYRYTHVKIPNAIRPIIVREAKSADKVQKYYNIYSEEKGHFPSSSLLYTYPFLPSIIVDDVSRVAPLLHPSSPPVET